MVQTYVGPVHPALELEGMRLPSVSALSCERYWSESAHGHIRIEVILCATGLLQLRLRSQAT